MFTLRRHERKGDKCTDVSGDLSFLHSLLGKHLGENLTHIKLYRKGKFIGFSGNRLLFVPKHRRQQSDKWRRSNNTEPKELEQMKRPKIYPFRCKIRANNFFTKLLQHTTNECTTECHQMHLCFTCLCFFTQSETSKGKKSLHFSHMFLKALF